MSAGLLCSAENWNARWKREALMSSGREKAGEPGKTRVSLVGRLAGRAVTRAQEPSRTGGKDASIRT